MEYLTFANFFDMRFTIIEETTAEAYIRKEKERKARREARRLKQRPRGQDG